MNTPRWVILIGAIVSSVGTTHAQAPVITSFHTNGQITWTNALNTNMMYRVEWAPQLGGPWYQTFQNIRTIDARNLTNFTVAVPMFYRVVMVTNRPPVGMVWVDDGEFVMGDSLDGWIYERPVHTNFVSGFWMDEAPVSWMKWDEVYSWAGTNGYFFDNAGSGKTNTHPVQSVNWYDCVKWCNARSQKEGLTPCYYTADDLATVYTNGQLSMSNAWVNWTADGYRLPTEAEWEKAARGGRQMLRFPHGNTIDHSLSNYKANTNIWYDKGPLSGDHPSFAEGDAPFTSPVGSFTGNGFGLHDMDGNIMNWCWDRYLTNAYTAAHQSDPRGPDTPIAANRVARGGCWDYDGRSSRCSCRAGYLPTQFMNVIGFRCVRRQ